MKPIRFISILFLLAFSSAEAAHIIGGEMYYDCIGENEYAFTMKLFRDCNSTGAPFDAPAFFSVYDQNGVLISNFTEDIDNVTPITPDLSSPCISFPPDICVQQGTYNFIVNLPNNTEPYQVVYQRCCRNQTILNLTNPGDQGLTIVALVPALPFDDCNSRPRYTNFPPPVLCAQEFLEFDHSATDPDGDSLAYSLCSPFIGATPDNPAPGVASAPPYQTVVWGAGFQATSPLNADPGLTIDPITGLLSGTPTQLGQFVVGVCVEEWRNGQLLSVNTRDFQFNVAFCEQLSVATLAQPEEGDLCQDLIFDFENLSDPNNTFLWDFGDPTTTTDISGLYSPSYTYPDTGTYTVQLITNPGFFCSDTATLILPLYYETQIDVQIASFECIDGIQVFNFAAAGVFNEESAEIIWNFGPNATPSAGSGLEVAGITFSNVGPQEIDVQVVDNVCDSQDAVTVNIPEPPDISIDPQEVFCNGLNYQFTQTSANASLYSWDFGVDGIDTDVSSLAAAGFTFPEPGNYTVTLTANTPQNCPVTVTEDFDIRTLLAPQIAPNDIACLEGNSIDFEAAGSFTAQAQFAWTFDSANPGSSTAQNPTGISFESAGTHDVSVAVSENGCTRSAERPMVIHANPIADFAAGPLEGCVPLVVNFNDQSLTESSSVAYDWDFGDGGTSTSRNASHEYTSPGTYSVSFNLENLNGCIDSDFKQRNAIIEVTPSPTAIFKIEPPIVSAVDPTFDIIGLSIGATSCSYLLDGQIVEDCDFTHTLDNVVPQTIMLTVKNEFGCISRAEGDIRISDHLIYIPNSFTPDEDGLNDIFRPVTTGVVNLEILIIDRWGTTVYHNRNETIGWNGQSPNEDYYAPAAVYQYIMRVTDNLGWNFEYVGSVRLIR